MKPGSIYDVLIAPVITEKATMLAEHNQFVFKVHPRADKGSIKASVEAIFKVKVAAVNTLNVKGKQKRFRGRLGSRPDVKKAIVTLEPGHRIDLSGGI
jgi:large subunit ribosomal protein L23